MKKIYDISVRLVTLMMTLVVTGGVVGVLTACSGDGGDSILHATGDAGVAQDGTVSAYLALDLALNGGEAMSVSGTRANPNGGEEGDGREPGQSYENTITSATLFVYPAGKDINDDAHTGTKVTMLRFDNIVSDGGSTVTVKRQVDMEPGQYKTLVVVNATEEALRGLKTKNDNGTLTLGDLRGYQLQGRAWTASGEDCSAFTMASAINPTSTLDGEFYIDDTKWENDPARVTVYVERVAARIDYRAKGAMVTVDGTGTPTFTEATDGVYHLPNGGTVKIVGATIVNDLKAGSYMLKRVAPTVDGTVSYLGDETPVSGVQTNYVLDPWTQQKTLDAENLGGTAFTTVYDNYFPTLADGTDNNGTGKWTAEAWKTATPARNVIVRDAGDNDKEWRRIGYTLENTTDNSEELGDKYNTAVIFRAEYTPPTATSAKAGNMVMPLATTIGGLTVEDEATKTVRNTFEGWDNGGDWTKFGYEEGDAYFIWNGKNYASLLDIMVDYDGTGYNPSNNPDQWMKLHVGYNTYTAWSELKSILTNGSITYDPLGYANYLVGVYNENKGNTEYGAFYNVYQQHLWSAYVKKAFGYYLDETTGKVKITRAGADFLENKYGVTLVLATDGSTIYEGDGTETGGADVDNVGGTINPDLPPGTSGPKARTCYYVWRVRHSNDGSEDATGVMEYGIVRNNVYKLNIKSISEPGSSTPEFDDPTGVRITITATVKPWTVMHEEEIVM